MILNEETLKQLSNEYIKGLAILSKMKEEGARPHDYLKHSLKFFKFKENHDFVWGSMSLNLFSAKWLQPFAEKLTKINF